MDETNLNISEEDVKGLWKTYSQRFLIKSPGELIDTWAYLFPLLITWMVSGFSLLILKRCILVIVVYLLYVGMTYIVWRQSRNSKTGKYWKRIFVICRIGHLGIGGLILSISFLSSSFYFYLNETIGDTPMIIGIAAYVIIALILIIAIPLIFLSQNPLINGFLSGKRYPKLEKYASPVVGFGVLLGILLRDSVGGSVVAAVLSYSIAIFTLILSSYKIFQVIFLATKTKMV